MSPTTTLSLSANPSNEPSKYRMVVAQLAISIRRCLQDRRPDPLVLGIIRQGRPEPQNFGAALLRHGLGFDAVTDGLGHLLTLFIEGEPMRKNRVERRAPARAA